MEIVGFATEWMSSLLWCPIFFSLCQHHVLAKKCQGGNFFFFIQSFDFLEKTEQKRMNVRSETVCSSCYCVVIPQKSHLLHMLPSIFVSSCLLFWLILHWDKMLHGLSFDVCLWGMEIKLLVWRLGIGSFQLMFQIWRFKITSRHLCGQW